VALFQKLATAAPAIPEYQYELATSHNTLGELLQRWDRPAEAEAAYRQAIAVLERVVAAHPDDARFQSQLADTLHNLGELQRVAGKLAEARQLADQAVQWQKKALERDPQQAQYRQSLRGHLLLLGPVLGQLGSHVEAADVAAELARDYPTDVQCTYVAACIWGRCVACVEQAAELPAAKRQELARTYGDRAVQALRDLVERGHSTRDQLRTDSDLKALRGRADFDRLIAEPKGKQ
jgi:tetratricopeptide (TPR) repeat protein